MKQENGEADEKWKWWIGELCVPQKFKIWCFDQSKDMKLSLSEHCFNVSLAC